MVDQIDASGNAPSLIVPKLPEYYNFSHKNRGSALIFNHEHFSIKDMKPRKGSKVDCERLRNSLELLKFKVKLLTDFNYIDIRQQLKIASRKDHTENDCLLIVLMTHGEHGFLYAKDVLYDVKQIWEFFTPQNCPSLAGKPKLFFFQACQGDECDPGISLECKKPEVDGMASWSYTLNCPDLLIAYSTIPGYYSWRNKQSGSWFIESLCEELDKNATKYNILTLLTFVCQTVAFEYESNHTDVEMDQMKQIPCITTTLTKLLKFD